MAPNTDVLSGARLDRSAVKVNVGCGRSPIPGWVNIDNSLSVRLARLRSPALHRAARRLIGGARAEFARTARAEGIRYGDARSGLPFADGVVDIVYSSHMFEHLSPGAAIMFLAEAHRVLRTGGVLRLVVPDLSRLVSTYQETADADAFVSSLHMSPPDAGSLIGRLQERFGGFRGHRWMYDERSLTDRVVGAGFVDVTALPAGATTIAVPNGLDLSERRSESIYIEGTRP
jgi:SAM-dependent methyltransferase